MKRCIVESEFEHANLTCVVIMQACGYRCGYVGVPKGHCLYKKDYGSYLKSKKENIENYFRCHGDITYSGGGEKSNYPIESDLWWFGFDCAHAYDKFDYETAKKLFADDEESMELILFNEKSNDRFLDNNWEIRTLEYVSNECKKLAEQLANFKDESE